MAEHKFVYTVAGVELSDSQKARISQLISAAVTEVITGDEPEEFRSNLYLTNIHIAGGIWVGSEFGIETLQLALAELEGFQPGQPLHPNWG